jgi:hypothetical protein
MASHGVTLDANGNVPPPPDANAGTTTLPGATTTAPIVHVTIVNDQIPPGIDAKTYRAARQACKSALPTGGVPSPEGKVAQCLRDKGYDPTVASPDKAERAARQACRADASTSTAG